MLRGISSERISQRHRQRPLSTKRLGPPRPALRSEGVKGADQRTPLMVFFNGDNECLGELADDMAKRWPQSSRKLCKHIHDPSNVFTALPL